VDYRTERYDWQEIFTADTRISAFSYHPSIHRICGQYSGALRQTALHIPDKVPTPASSLLRRMLGDVELLQFGQWEYSISFVHKFQIFEMSLLGYAGYLPFGLECTVIGDLMERWMKFCNTIY